MLEPKHFARATESSLDFIGNQERSIFSTKLLRANEEISLRSLTAFPLNGLDHERRHIARTKLAVQFIDVVERHARVEALHQRSEAFGKAFATHQRQRTNRQAVKRAGQRYNAFSFGCGAGEFERAFHCFGAGIAEEHRVQMRRCPFHQGFS